ncbi:NUDIX domain-containing protein [Microlunatus sp. Gsoil 973]|uniref:NUDIX hydrolase n=1 Tax=Microlunatus sp. Gsoil 973 TaxID=2672569 RepID=UPI0018A8652A|nr:NUDIX domain-containing protein [Microlunatus sp. Gsoil 973]
MRVIEAAGAVVLRRTGDATEALVVHRPRYDDWSLPKGKLEPGEISPTAAVREVLEETGTHIRLQAPLDATSYLTPKSAEKTVSWWRGTVLDDHQVRASAHDDEDRYPEISEVDDVAWLSIDEAADRLHYDLDRTTLDQAMEQPVTTPLIIVRHAKAINRKDWHGTDPDRPLRPRGRVQSRQLINILGAYGIRELYTSPWLRCTATLQPYALDARLSSTALAILNEELGADDPAGVSEAMDGLRERAVVEHRPIAVCGHRPVLPAMLAALDVPDRPLTTAECVVVHLTDTAAVHAVEFHRPLA